MEYLLLKVLIPILVAVLSVVLPWGLKLLKEKTDSEIFDFVYFKVLDTIDDGLCEIENHLRRKVKNNDFEIDNNTVQVISEYIDKNAPKWKKKLGMSDDWLRTKIKAMTKEKLTELKREMKNNGTTM